MSEVREEVQGSDVSEGTCPVCRDDLAWCPEYRKANNLPLPGSEPETPTYLITCGYCDAPTFVQGEGHSTYCPRYEKQKKVRQPRRRP